MITRHFTGGKEAILQSLLSFLRERSTETPYDLSGFGILVPTRNVARRVRTAIAKEAGRDGRALLSPQIYTPGSLFPALSDQIQTASRAVRILAAAAAIEKLDESSRIEALGMSPVNQLSDRLEMARFFLETRSKLGEGAIDIAAVAAHSFSGDRERWAALADCERLYRDELGRMKREDPDDLAARIAKDPGDWFRGDGFVVAGAPDFPPRVSLFLENISESLPVDILVLAGVEESERFDAFGRPSSEAFESVSVNVPPDTLWVNSDVGQALAAMADRLERYPDSRSACVCGVGRPESATALSFELQSRGMSPHDPAGISFSASGAGRFFRSLAGVCFGDEVDDLVSWLRDPFVAQWMAGDPPGEETSQQREKWIVEADKIRQQTLPTGVMEYLELLDRKGRRPVFGETLKLRRLANRLEDPFSLFVDKAVVPLLAAVRRADGVEEFADRLHEIREIGLMGGAKKPDEKATLFLWGVQEAMDFAVYPEKTDEGIDVLGWLELLWDERPWLQIPDLYDGSIPSVVGAHPLIPEQLMQELGLPGRRSRDTRDAYILAALCRLRESGGRVDLHVPVRDAEGAAVQPSRLLYYTELEDLPERVKKLTQDPWTPDAEASAKKPLIVPDAGKTVETWAAELEHVSITAFASYLRCPFSFLLERVLGYEGVDPDRMEMDPRDFGTGVHEVLQSLDEDGELEWNRLDNVEREASGRLELWFRRAFGSSPGLLLQLQYEALWRRVRAAARIRFEARQQGWSPVKVEWGFGEEADLSVEGVALRGKIDLLEEREGELRIVDYKTSDKPKSPLEAHRIRLSGRGGFQPPELFPFPGGDSAGWTNLQLPLYAAAVRRVYPGRPIRVAYGHLPRAVTESCLEEWDGFDEALIDSALEAASRIVQFWRGKGFWPPVKGKFKKSDAFEWSGPAGMASWARGELMDLSLMEEGGPEL